MDFELNESQRKLAAMVRDFCVSEVKPQTFAVANLKPLTPEQLAYSAMQASGLTDAERKALGKNLTDTVVTRREHTLVTTGPYAFVRHPFYDTGILGVVAISLITANWFILLMGAAVMVLLIFRTKTEEENLLARFGESYREYMKRTGRFFPRIG